jgi:hypothetical protein
MPLTRSAALWAEQAACAQAAEGRAQADAGGLREDSSGQGG